MNSTLRLPITALGGFLFAAMLFWLLWFLIHHGSRNFEVREALKIDFTQLRQDTKVESRRNKADPVRPTQVPQIPQMNTSVSGGMEGGLNLPSTNVEVTGIGGVSIGAGSDRDVIPLVRINPDYPRRAQERGVEGWVQLEFTITPAGTTSNVRVISGQPAGMFDDAAIKAVSRWKYNPRVVDGVAVEQPGIRIRLRFDLEDNKR